MRKPILLAATLALATPLMLVHTGPAEAAGCIYRVEHHGFGILSIGGHGYAAKKKKACKRAEAKCNRRLKRARKNAKLPRGGPRDFRCVRVASQ